MRDQPGLTGATGRASPAQRWLVSLLAGWVAGACAGGEPGQRTPAERDSAGITIVTSTPPFAAWRLGPTPLVRIGTREGEAAYLLHNVVYAARAGDGRVVVVHGGTQDIRWYAATGEHLATVGRRGEGPGEFRTLRSALLTPSDSLIVYDARNQRLTWLADAAIAREQWLAGLIGSNAQLLGAAADGSVVIADHRPAYTMTAAGFNYTRDTVRVVAVSIAGVDTLTHLAGSEATTWVALGPDGRAARMQQFDLPFSYRTLVGRVDSFLIAATGDRPELELRDRQGSVVRVARRADVTARLVSQPDRDQYTEHAVQQARERGARDLGIIEESARDRLAALPDDHAVPVYDHLLVDTEGRAWVRAYAAFPAPDAGRHWTVYDASGRVLATLATPAHFEVMHIGHGHLTGIARDELDVQYVTVWRIVASS